MEGEPASSKPVLGVSGSSVAQGAAAGISFGSPAAIATLPQLPVVEPLQQLSSPRQIGFASPVAIPPARSPAVQSVRPGSPLSPVAQQLRRPHNRSPSFGASSQPGHPTGSGSSSPASTRRPALSKSVSHGSNSSSVGSFNANRSISSHSHSAAAAAADAVPVSESRKASPNSKSLHSPKGHTWHKSSSFSPRQYNARIGPKVSLKHIQVGTALSPRTVTSPRSSMSPGQRVLFTDDVELTPPALLLGSSPGAPVFSPQALASMLRRETSAASGATSPFAAAAGSTSSPPKRRATSSSVPYFQRAGSSASSSAYDVAAILGSPGPGGTRPGLSSSPGGLAVGRLHSAGSGGKRRATADCIYEPGHAGSTSPQPENSGGKSSRSSASSSRRTSHNQPPHQQQRQGSGHRILDATSGQQTPAGPLAAGQQQHGSSLHGSPGFDVEVRQQRRSGSLGVHFAVADGPADEQHTTLRHGTPYPGKTSSDSLGDAQHDASRPPQHQQAVTFVVPHDHVEQQQHKLHHGTQYPGREYSFGGAGSPRQSADSTSHVQNGLHTHAAEGQQQQQQASPRSPRSPKAVSFNVPNDAAEQEHATLRHGTPYPDRPSSPSGQSHELSKVYESPSLTDLVRCGQQTEGQQQKPRISDRSASGSGQSFRHGSDTAAARPAAAATAGVRFDVPADSGAGEVVGEDYTFARKGTPFPGREDRRLGDEQQSDGVRFLVADPLPAAAAAGVVPSQQVSRAAAADKQYTHKATPHPGKLDELTGRHNPADLVGVQFTVAAGTGSGEVFKQHTFKRTGTPHPAASSEHQDVNPAVSVRFSAADGQGAGEVNTGSSYVRKGTPFPGRLDSLTEDQRAATAAAAGTAVRFAVAEGQGAGELVADHSYTRKGTPHPGRLDSLTDSPSPAAGVRFSVEQGQGAGEVVADHSYTRKGTPHPSRPDTTAEHQQAGAARASAGVRFSVAEGGGVGEVNSEHGYARKGTPHPGRLDSLPDSQSGDFGITTAGDQGSDEWQHSTDYAQQATAKSPVSPNRLGEESGVIRVRFSITDGGRAGEADTEHHFVRQPTPFVREEDIDALELQQQQQRQLVHVKFSLREGQGAGERDDDQHRVVRKPTPFVRRGDSLDLEQPGPVRFGLPEGQGPGEQDQDHGQRHQRKPTPFVPRENRHSGATGGVGFSEADASHANGQAAAMQPPSSDSSHLQPSQQQQQRRSRSSGSSVHFAAEPGPQSPRSTRSTPRSSSSSPVMQQCSTYRGTAGSEAQPPNTGSPTGHSTSSSKGYSSRCSTGVGLSADQEDNLTYSRGSTTGSNCSESPPRTARSTISSANSSTHGGRQYRPVQQQQQQHDQQDQQHYTRKDTPYPLGQGDDHSHDLMLDLLQQELAAVAAGGGHKPTGTSPPSASSSVGPSSMRVSRSSTGSAGLISLSTQPLRSSMKQSSSNNSRRSSYTAGQHGRTVKLSVSPYIAVVHIPATGGIWDQVYAGRVSPTMPLSKAASGAMTNISPRSPGALLSPGNPLSPTNTVASAVPAGSRQSVHHVSAPCSLSGGAACLSGPNSFKSGPPNAPVSGPVLGASPYPARRESSGITGLQPVPETDYKPSRSEGSWTLSSRSPQQRVPVHSNSANAGARPQLQSLHSLGAGGGSGSNLSSSTKGEHHHSGILAKAAHAANRLLHKTSSGRHKPEDSSPSSPKGSPKAGKSAGKQLLHAISWMSNKGSPQAPGGEMHQPQQQTVAGGGSNSSVASPHGKPPVVPGSPGSGRRSFEGRGLGHSTSSAATDHARGSSSKRVSSSSSMTRDEAAAAAEGSPERIYESFVPDEDSAVDPAAVALADLFCSRSQNASRKQSATIEQQTQ